jgi:hypothetical protein
MNHPDVSLCYHYPYKLPAKKEHHPPPLQKRQACEARRNQKPFSELLNNRSGQRTPILDDVHYIAE